MSPSPLRHDLKLSTLPAHNTNTSSAAAAYAKHNHSNCYVCSSCAGQTFKDNGNGTVAILPATHNCDNCALCQQRREREAEDPVLRARKKAEKRAQKEDEAREEMKRKSKSVALAERLEEAKTKDPELLGLYED